MEKKVSRGVHACSESDPKRTYLLFLLLFLLLLFLLLVLFLLLFGRAAVAVAVVVAVAVAVVRVGVRAGAITAFGGRGVLARAARARAARTVIGGCSVVTAGGRGFVLGFALLANLRGRRLRRFSRVCHDVRTVPGEWRESGGRSRSEKNLLKKWTEGRP